MKQYIRTKLTFISDPKRIREITEELGTEQDPIRFERILPLEGEDPFKKWGTSQDCEETDLIVYRNGTWAEYSFDVLKTVPLPVYRKLTEKYPDAEVRIDYASEDYGNDCGRYESPAGSDELETKEIDDPFVFACDVWEVDPEEQMAEEMINYYEE
ncbi:MAG: hypothetical protein IKS51_06290 [Erysipelotrichaceae bacterium]|nr:hypothetical protein [Erysipelotrichaceae bacterium]